MNARSFEDVPAIRTRVPLLIGIMGPSGSGKTFSAGRLAAGMQKVTGGEIFVVDTESRRALHYADVFKFRHVNFTAPFSPLDYLQVFEHCKKKGATTVIVDSMSHEHEGPGGVLEWHQTELDRLTKGDEGRAEKMNMLAWAAPKQARRRLINTLMQMDMNVILCFRAKDKLKLERGKNPESMGWMPIAGEEFLYEMNVNFLLGPAAGGVPQWDKLTPHQEQFIKVPPKHFRDLLREPKPLDEEIGERMAMWAAGVSPKASKAEMQALVGAMVSAGFETSDARQKWLAQTLPGKKPDDLTSGDVSVCMQALKEAA